MIYNVFCVSSCTRDQAYTTQCIRGVSVPQTVFTCLRIVFKSVILLYCKNLTDLSLKLLPSPSRSPVLFEQGCRKRGMLVEVKPEFEWRNHWRSWLSKWKAAYRWAVERDFLFHIYDESRIRGQRLANIKTLSRFLDKQSDDALAGLIADFVGDSMVSMGDILSHFSTFPVCSSEVYRMLANRGLFFDLEGPLSADTLIWRKND